MEQNKLKDYITKLQPQVNKVLHYCEELTIPVTNMHTDGLFADWATNKEHIFHAFGDELRVSIPEQTYSISQEEKDCLFDQLIDELMDLWTSMSLSDSEWQILQDFLVKFRHCWMQNYTDTSYVFNKGQETISIPKGTKIAKDLKYIISNEDVLNNVQQIISKYIQKDKIKGTLYLSIHPLDYLSLSETNHGWRSCHALDGEFCAGNLEYMADSSTIVCYLVTEDRDVKLPNFPEDVPWNSKAWRVLIHTDQTMNMFWLNKSYPYNNEVLNNAIAKKLCELKLSKSFHWKSTYRGLIQIPSVEAIQNGEYLILDYPVAVFRDESVHNVKEFFQLEEDKNFYFDILQSSSLYFVPKWLSNYSPERSKDIKIPIGHKVKCVCCGRDKFYSSNAYLCEDCLVNKSDKHCEGVTHCQDCGRRIISDNSYYIYDTDEVLCKSCYNDRVKDDIISRHCTKRRGSTWETE